MAVSPETVAETELGIIFKRIHLSSKILAAFPFTLRGRKYLISPAEMIYSLITLSVYGYIATVTGLEHLGQKKNLMLKLALTLPHQTVFTVLLINIFWLAFNMKSMSAAFEGLQLIQTRIRTKLDFSHRYMGAFSGAIMTEYAFTYFFYEESYFAKDYGTVIFVFLVTFAIVDQFAAQLAVVRIFYKHICDKLNSQTAEEFTDIHDRLAQCCGFINHCYSPQLLLVSLAAVLYNVSLLYIAITQFQVKGNFDITCVLATLMFFIIVMHFTRSCRLTKVQSERFNKLLYRLIINQESKELMKNKRIMLHYKGTKELQFSAIGFINVDYPLICSMVSTATTYILILVQFSG